MKKIKEIRKFLNKSNVLMHIFRWSYSGSLKSFNKKLNRSCYFHSLIIIRKAEKILINNLFISRKYSPNFISLTCSKFEKKIKT